MKTKYKYMHAVGAITTDTVLYTVTVGDNKRDKKLLQRALFLTAGSNHYFHVNDSDTADFCYNVAKSLYPDAINPLAVMQTDCITIAQLVSFLTDNDFPAVNVSHVDNYQRQMTEPKFFYLQHQLCKRI